MGFGNPQALREVWEKEVSIYKSYGALPESYDPKSEIDIAIQRVEPYVPFKKVFAHSTLKNFEDLKNALGKARQSSEYRELVETCSPGWYTKNILPLHVQYALISARASDYYLYTIRGFLPPSSVDVYLSKNESDLGSSFNPGLSKPYMTMKVLPMDVLQNQGSSANKKILDNALVTFTHELFHVTQSSRYIYTVDWSKNTWFWEATATVLENEAAQYYRDMMVISDTYEVERHGYDEAYSRSLGLPGYWGSLSGDPYATQNQGYMMGYVLMELRDHYVVGQGVKADDYLKKLMNAFKGSLQKPIYTIIEQTTNSGERFEIELKAYFIKYVERIARKTSQSSQDKNGTFYVWVNEPEFKLSEATPFVEIGIKKNPLAAPLRQLSISLDSTKFSKKEDVTLVIKRGPDDMQNNQDLALMIGNGAFSFTEFTEKTIQAFPNYGLNPFGYIQEIHLYPDGWLNDFTKPYQAFIMIKPDAPQIQLKDSQLTLTIPKKSPLWQKGLVKSYMVTILDPLGNTVLMETDNEKLELTLGPSGGFTDLDDPAIQKMMGTALRKYLASNPDYAAQLEKEYGKDVLEKAIDGVASMELQIGVMSRAAEVLQQAMMGAGPEKEIRVSVQEIIDGDRPILGPKGEEAIEKVEAVSTGGVSIIGTWKGKVQFTNENVTFEISAGKYGYDYTIVNSMYIADDVIFYGKDNNNGTVSIYMGMVGQEMSGTGEPFTTLIKNSDKELYLVAPPTTLIKN